MDDIINLKLPSLYCEDKLLWTRNKSRRFYAKNCYLVDRQEIFNLAMDDFWMKLWNSNALERHKVFMWRLFSKAFPTKFLLQQRLGIQDAFCVMCGEADDSLLHLFRFCPVIQRLDFASKWSFRLDSFQGDTWDKWIKLCLDPPTI